MLSLRLRLFKIAFDGLYLTPLDRRAHKTVVKLGAQQPAGEADQAIEKVTHHVQATLKAMNRRGFLQAIAGALVAAPAATALVLRAPQSVAKFEPQELTAAAVNWTFLSLVACELESGKYTNHVFRLPLAQEPGTFGNPRQYQQLSTVFELERFPALGVLAERYLQPAARVCAARLLDEAERGGRGLRLFPMSPIKPLVFYVTGASPWRRGSPAVSHVAVTRDLASRFVSATNYSVVHERVVTFGRFDVAYVWEQRQPLRPRKRFAYDPARLPA